MQVSFNNTQNFGANIPTKRALELISGRFLDIPPTMNFARLYNAVEKVTQERPKDVPELSRVITEISKKLQTNPLFKQIAERIEVLRKQIGNLKQPEQLEQIKNIIDIIKKEFNLGKRMDINI